MSTNKKINILGNLKFVEHKLAKKKKKIIKFFLINLIKKNLGCI